jgi:predicted Co/Zn/Cd cation transporter (cation efflux family)
MVDDIEIPEILRTGRHGSNVKVWAFLYVNSGQWFTSRDIAGYLSLPLSTVQLALRQVHRMAPRVQREDIEVLYRGRREKRYRFQRLINSI